MRDQSLMSHTTVLHHLHSESLLTAYLVCAGAKLFYLSGMKNGKYMKREVLNLARFISVMKFRPLSWRMAHPYLLTDRLEVSSNVLNTGSVSWSVT